jgi:hypothetical protein
MFILLILFILMIPVCLILGFNLAWLLYHSGKDGYNWRVCLGPGAYFKWLKKNEKLF